MSTLVEVAILIIAAAIVLFILVFIPVLIKIGRAASELAKLADMVRYHVAPISQDLAIILSKAKVVSDSLGRQMGQIEGSIRKLKAYESVFDEKVGKPFMDMIAVISGFIKGFRTFMRHIRKK
jgi:uncharacterized protein YoxC